MVDFLKWYAMLGGFFIAFLLYGLDGWNGLVEEVSEWEDTQIINPNIIAGLVLGMIFFGWPFFLFAIVVDYIKND